MDSFDLCRKLQPLVTELRGGDALVCYSPIDDCLYIVDTRQRMVWHYLTRANIEDNLHNQEAFLRERLTGKREVRDDFSF